MARGYPDYEGDKSGLYLKPEWAAKEGVDWWRSDSAVGKAWGEYVEITYTVTALKTLYITQYSFGSTANLVGDGDNNQFCYFQIQDITDIAFPVRQTANGGGGLAMNKPAVFEAGHAISILLINYANHKCDLRVSVGGYEV